MNHNSFSIGDRLSVRSVRTLLDVGLLAVTRTA